MAQTQVPDAPLTRAGIPGAHEILMQVPISIFTSTPEGRFIFANPATAGMFGYGKS